jgi:nitrate reductase cytochrome c-type subunit
MRRAITLTAALVGSAAWGACAPTDRESQGRPGAEPSAPAWAEPLALPPPSRPVGAEADPLPDPARSEPTPARPGPNRARGERAVEESRACERCHQEEARQWRGSGHHDAFTDAPFQAALAHEAAKPFCRGCHAPEADPQEEPSPNEGAHGVGCVSCHVVEAGAVLAAPRMSRAGTAEVTAPHAIVRSEDFGNTGACVGCHEFRFPGLTGASEATFMQTTVREHTRSASADRPCASCHMPEGSSGRRSHAFREVRDPSWLRASLAAEARVDEDGVVTVTLRQTSPGHAFPTGDLFRRLEVGAELRGPEGEVRGRVVRHLARHFEIRPGRPGRQLVADDRVFDAPRDVELDLALARAALPSGAITWWVTYQRVAQTQEGIDPSAVEIESEVPLHTGRL